MDKIREFLHQWKRNDFFDSGNYDNLICFYLIMTQLEAKNISPARRTRRRHAHFDAADHYYLHYLQNFDSNLNHS